MTMKQILDNMNGYMIESMQRAGACTAGAAGVMRDRMRMARAAQGRGEGRP